MAAEDVDRYPAALEEPKRSTLEALRRTIADFAAFKDHLSYLPFSGLDQS